MEQCSESSNDEHPKADMATSRRVYVRTTIYGNTPFPFTQCTELTFRDGHAAADFLNRFDPS